MKTTLALFLFAVTLTVSAALLFVMEPMIAKMLLPLLGGSPGVWNTCMVFFQLTLLLGYLYAHLVSTRLSAQAQLVVHAIVLFLPLLVLPTRVAGLIPPPPETAPFFWLFWALTMVVGLPFFAVSTTAPLLQKWFASLNLKSSSDPYFLFTASNFGSLIGLIGYPFLIEPRLTLSQQSSYWQAGYGALLLFALLCGAMRFAATKPPDNVSSAEGLAESEPRSGVDSESSEQAAAGEDFDGGRADAGGGQGPSQTDSIDEQTVKEKQAVPFAVDGGALVTAKRRIQWVLLTAIPSSLVLGLTTFVTTSMASLPLLWVIPLTIYLVSIILAFVRLPAAFFRILEMAMPWLIVANFILVTTCGIGHGFHISNGLPLQLITLFVVSTVLHAKVAADRPDTRYLTEFYFFFSLGGVLGSLVNALAAPMILSSPLEYPLVLGATAVLFLRPLPSRLRLPADKLFPVWVMPVAVVGLTYFLFSEPSRAYYLSQTGPTSLYTALLQQAWRVAVPLLLVLLAARNRTELRSALAIVFVLSAWVGEQQPEIIYRSRNFFGVSTIRVVRSQNVLELYHDVTMHGNQSLDPDLRYAPLSYFTQAGPIGMVLTRMFGDIDKPGVKPADQGTESDVKPLAPRANFAVVGLGCGTLSAYAHPGQKLFLYEINPRVVQLATDPFYFTYVYSAYRRGVLLNFLIGDARIKLQEAPDNSFGVIVLDAFSSDVMPLHLMTREALQLYLRKLAPGGVIAYHASSKYYDIVPILWNLIRDARLHGLICYGDRTDPRIGRTEALWVLVMREKETMQKLKLSPLWLEHPVIERPEQPVWTDDYCNPLAFIKDKEVIVQWSQPKTNPESP
ncbi:MAG TPA: fused MFS/spermidine synthase [Candidatus Obscuribacterales bacterium]